MPIYIAFIPAVEDPRDLVYIIYIAVQLLFKGYSFTQVLGKLQREYRIQVLIRRTN